MTTRFTLRTALMGALLPALIATAAPAFAQTDEPAALKVQLAGLNLNTEQGAQVALRRIESAAEQVCGGAPDRHRVADLDRYDHCHQAAVIGAVHQLGQPMLSQLVESSPPVRLASR